MYTNWSFWFGGFGVLLGCNCFAFSSLPCVRGLQSGKGTLDQLWEHLLGIGLVVLHDGGGSVFNGLSISDAGLGGAERIFELIFPHGSLVKISSHLLGVSFDSVLSGLNIVLEISGGIKDIEKFVLHGTVLFSGVEEEGVLDLGNSVD